ncbi:MAG TPA: prolyl oligopeptidase family serine peptidase [Caulobacteraceae bacterium]|nr:prolyl oligopeptidase family serine peptidase [Caulobacteraceae bacterium]
MKRVVTGMRMALLAAAMVVATTAAAAAAPSLEAVLGYPFQSSLVAAEHGGAIAWVQTVRGVRNVWLARAPDYVPRQVTANAADDGQELTNLVFSPDGTRLAWVRGGDHDANWPAEGGLAPDPAASPEQPQVTIWAVDAAAGGPPVKVAEGDFPAISAKGVLAFVKDKQVWTAALDGKGKAERLFFDRGKDGELAWSPDGERLAFVSNRGDHGFVGVFSGKDRALVYLAPSTGRDDEPRWSPDGRRIAFTRRPGQGGAPEPILEERPQPWSIWVADADGGAAHKAWDSPKTLEGSYPKVEGEANLNWCAGDRLVFLAESDNWQHLYSVPAAGGEALLLTPGPFMVEHVARGLDGRSIIYDANTGADAEDGERRHLFQVPVDSAAPATLTRGDGIDWTPVAVDRGHVAYIAAGPEAPPLVALVGHDGGARRVLAAGAAADYPTGALVVPRPVTFKAADGLTIHGVLFEAPMSSSRDGASRAKARPAVIFVHGGPPRQMLLGWHYMDYYTHAFAMNQFLAGHGYVVLSVNYRLGIGYGRAFNHALHAGFRGAAEYQDVLAAGRFLQSLPEVDPARIGIWGGSYGGYLTAMALARNSDVFKVGVDLHGVHDWSATLARELPPASAAYEKGDRDAAMAVAFKASPVVDLSHWTSPVLLIQGDDDRNVAFHETVDLARRLDERGTPYEELVLPNEIHGFLRYGAWLASDRATVDFLDRHLHPGD